MKEKVLYGADLAALHSRHYSDFVASASPQVIHILQACGVRSGLVCDVGCGGGQLSAALLSAGYETIGVDVSSAMVRLARRQVPAGKFVCSSITNAALPACVAAVAVGEVFNYLGSKHRIKRAFNNLFRALLPGGILIFDIKQPLGQELAKTICRTGPDWAVVAEITENPVRRALVRRIDSFRKMGRHYRRQTETHTLSIYPAAEIGKVLRSAGFQARILTGYGSHKLPPDRKVLLARKPARLSKHQPPKR